MENRLEDINIRSICVDLLKNCWVIILAAVSVYLGVTGVYRLRYVPKYTASATVAVTAKGSSGSVYTSLSLTNEMAQVLGEVFKSDALKKKIEEDLGGESINGTLGATVIEETNLLILSATAETPRETYLMIWSALRNYDSVSDYLFSNARLDMVKEPSVPYSPSNVQNIGKIQKMGMAAGGGLAAAAIILMSYLRFTVKTKETARRQLDGHVIGVIPYETKNRTLKTAIKRRKKALLITSRLHSMAFSESVRKVSTLVEHHMKRYETKNRTLKTAIKRRKKALLITSRLHSMAFSESVRKVSTLVEHHMKRRNQKILLITSAEENEGKSSVAVNEVL